MLLPFWSPSSQLVHIGTMSPGDKGRDSYEGHGLSVSECPEAWEEIARLGGNAWWSLKTTDGVAPVFLDWRQVDALTRSEIIHWGQTMGLCVPMQGFNVSRFDEDHGQWTFTTFEDESQAKSEHAFELEEHEANDGDQEKAPRFEAFGAWKLTPAAVASLSRRQVDLSESPVMLALLYTELETKMDGVYWDDRLDAASHSAPRAVIVPRKLWRFNVAPYVKEAAPRFEPRFFEDGCGLHYEDGRMYGAVDIYELPEGGRSLAISEWSSEFHGKGHSVQALEWLRPQFAHISANSVGTVDDGVPDVSTMYWAHMMSKGLVDEMFDDEGTSLVVDANGAIVPAPVEDVVAAPEPSPEPAPARRRMKA